MKDLNTYIAEAIKITSKSKVVKHNYNYYPKDKKELEEIVKQLIEERGYEADLNDIDTSSITDMSYLFSKYGDNGCTKYRNKCFMKFDGNISEWDVSNVKNMEGMFAHSEFTGEHGDISNWYINKVKNMSHMFCCSFFRIKIDNWDISNVKDMSYMFARSSLALFNQIPKWYDKNKWQ